MAIIAILASMLLPALGKARLAAQKSKCTSNLKQIGLMTFMYAGDNNDKLPALIAVNVGVVNPWQWEGSAVTSMRNDYGLKWELMCPMITNSSWTNGNFDAYVNQGIPNASPYLYNGPRYYYGDSPWPKLAALSMVDEPRKMLWCDINRIDSGAAENNNHPDLSMNICRLDGSVAGFKRNALCSNDAHGWKAFWSTYVCMIPTDVCPECNNW